ncbi:prepilin peptidase [Candidatus Saccharibacteria bacterium]|nr:prepilin peptidase [Candidatus Saccharibacteria bacterium]
MQWLFLTLLFILGACFGSFLCCQARRLHLKSNPKKKGAKTQLGSRSVCFHCHYQLKWYDNLPILSWMLLRGKCRKCHKKIGIAEILSELALALAFLSLGTTINIISANPLDWAIFIATLLFTAVLAFLAIYDGIYGELPTLYLIISIAIAVTILVLKEVDLLLTSSFTTSQIYNPLISILILGGLYLLLYKISHGKWVGDGDWLLGSSIAIALYDSWLALITLFLANLLACLVMYPILRKQKHAKIYFGPFMVIAFVITLTFQNFFYYAIS